MQIIATDLLADLSGLSLGLILLVIPVGLVLWLLGWWSHRFWIVLTTTVLAGIFGLSEATAWKAQPLVAAVLLAIAAGVLALALVRVIAFGAGGFAGVSLVLLLVPSLDQTAIVFLVSGLVSLLLFRWCFMILTSLLGSALLGYAGLALMHYYELLDAVAWSEQNTLVLNSICGTFTFFGFLFQFFLNRRQMRRGKADDDEKAGGFATVLGSFGGGGGKKPKRHAA